MSNIDFKIRNANNQNTIEQVSYDITTETIAVPNTNLPQGVSYGDYLSFNPYNSGWEAGGENYINIGAHAGESFQADESVAIGIGAGMVQLCCCR